MALSEDAPERRLLPVLMRELPQLDEARRLGLIEVSSEEVEVFVNAQQWLEEQKQEVARNELAALVALRLERALTEREHATITALLERGDKTALARAVLDHDAAGLVAWLDARAG